MLRIHPYFLVFQEGTSTIGEIMTALEDIVTGGVLLSSPKSMLGITTYTSALAVQPDTTSIGDVACLLDALKIDFDSAQSDNGVDYLTFKTNN